MQIKGWGLVGLCEEGDGGRRYEGQGGGTQSLMLRESIVSAAIWQLCMLKQSVGCGGGLPGGL